MLTDWVLTVTSGVAPRQVTYRFKATFEGYRNRRGVRQMQFLYGSSRTAPCVQMIAKDLIHFRDVTIVYLERLDYNALCSEHPDLQRGTFGTVVMLHSSIMLLKATCENATTLILEDHSAVDVVNQRDLDDKVLLSLVDFKMMTTGQTWYETVLPGLTPSGGPALRKVEACRRMLQSKLSQTSVDWTWLTDKLINHPPFISRSFWSPELEALLFETIRKARQTDVTVLTFFDTLFTIPLFDGFFFAHIMHHLQTAFSLESLDGITWTLDINAFALSSNAANIKFKDLYRNDPPTPFAPRSLWGGGFQSMKGQSMRRQVQYLGVVQPGDDID